MRRGRWLDALLLAGLVAATLVVAPGLPYAFQTPKDAVVCLAVGAGLVLAASEGLAPVPPVLAWPLLAIVVTGVASSAAADLWTHALAMEVVGILLFVLALDVFGAPAARERLAGVMVGLGALEAGLAVVQYALGPAALRLLGSATRRAYAFGTLGVPNWVGAFAAMAMAPALVAVPARPFATALLGAGLVATGSRGAWLAALAGVWVARRHAGLRRAAPALAAGALVGGVVLGTWGGVGHGAGSIHGRLLIWRATERLIDAHPVLGVGPGGFVGQYPAALHAVMTGPAAPAAGLRPAGFVAHAHNVLLQIAAERGTAGLAAFLWLASAIIISGRSRAEDAGRAALGGSVAACAVYGLVDDPLVSTPLAACAWLAAAAFASPEVPPAAAPRVVRVGLALAGVATAAFGLAALAGDRRLATAWQAAARSDGAEATTAAAAVRVGPGRGEARFLRGLVALGEGEPQTALDLLDGATREHANPDIYYALAVARARLGDLPAGLGTLDWLAATLPGLVGPHVFTAELLRRHDAPAGAIDAALGRALALARDTAPNPRLELFTALAAARRREGRPAGRPPLVLLDAGHGGRASGARAADGAAEKTLTLALAKRCAGALAARGVRVRLTRARDRDVALDARARIANEIGPALFVSLHANAAADAAARGTEVWSRTTELDAPPFPDLSARDTALLLNALPDGFKRAVAARRRLDRCGLAAAARIGDALAAATGSRPPLRAGPFYLLRQVQAPAVLVEVGYLTNADDARALRRASVRRTLAEAVAVGVADAISRSPGCGP